jgi:2'-hydroxyisoflavone reductase
VRASAELLRDSGHYVFISSISAYATPYRPGFDESAPLADLADPATEEISGNYGGLKAACERVVEDVFPGRCTLVRAGLIVGPHDPTGRFTYWPHRVARGGEVLAPGPPERPVQFVDVRDLAAWILSACTEPIPGAFTVTSPAIAILELLETCREALGADVTFAWASDDLLREHDVDEWMELPLWLVDPDYVHMVEADVSKATAAGLRPRPLAETIRDTLAQAETVDGVGLDPEKERRILLGR